MSDRSFYVTTPIYYVNDVPHIGHAYTTVAADALARWHRMRGASVFFLTGTDEHGMKVQRAAEARGVAPLAMADEHVARFQELWRQLGISNDDFIRTTQERHVRTVQRVFQELWNRGDIYLGTYEDWYCTPCETFFTETQLLENRCPDCRREVERVSEESYFFRMSKYQEPLLRHLRENPGFVGPATRRNEILSFVEGGLRDLSVSRTTFSWGIPVPFDPRHVIYVWIDALTNYITAAGAYDDPQRFARLWPADVHLIGKDIIRFHAVYWPTMLMALGLPLPRRVFAHGFWMSEGQKMSKSLGNVVDPGTVCREFGVDAFRYFLLREVPFGLDGDFSRHALIQRINADLANDLGNLVNRVLAMSLKYHDGLVPVAAPDGELAAAARTAWDGVVRAMDEQALHAALTAVWGLVSAANRFVDARKPWELAKAADRQPLDEVMASLLEALRVTAVLAAPFMPTTALRIWEGLGQEGAPGDRPWTDISWPFLAAGTATRPVPPLFPRIETG